MFFNVLDPPEET